MGRTTEANRLAPCQISAIVPHEDLPTHRHLRAEFGASGAHFEGNSRGSSHPWASHACGPGYADVGDAGADADLRRDLEPAQDGYPAGAVRQGQGRADPPPAAHGPQRVAPRRTAAGGLSLGGPLPRRSVLVHYHDRRRLLREARRQCGPLVTGRGWIPSRLARCIKAPAVVQGHDLE